MRADRPSGTALTIALSMLYLSRRPDGRRLVPALEAGLLEERVGRLGLASRLAAALARPGLGDLWVRALEACIVPGIVAHWALRKRAIEWLARDSLASGASQLVVIAAGFDTLAFRLSKESPGLRPIELDHPSTQRAKRELLGEAGGVVLVAADLARRRPLEALRESSFDPAAPTLFIIEGLSMYLSRQAVEALWLDLAAVPRARLVCTFMEPGPDGRAAFRVQTGLLRGFLALTGEPFAWGGKVAEIGGMLERCGWTPSALVGSDEFLSLAAAAGGLHSRQQPVGEYILVADRAWPGAAPVFDARAVLG